MCELRSDGQSPPNSSFSTLHVAHRDAWTLGPLNQYAQFYLSSHNESQCDTWRNLVHFTLRIGDPMAMGDFPSFSLLSMTNMLTRGAIWWLAIKDPIKSNGCDQIRHTYREKSIDINAPN